MRFGAVDPQTAGGEFAAGEFLGDLVQDFGVAGIAFAVAVEIVHPTVAVAVDEDVGGVAVGVTAVDGVVADRSVVLGSAEAAHHEEGAGRDSGFVNAFEQPFERHQKLGAQQNVRDLAAFGRAAVLLAEELAEPEMRRDRQLEIGVAHRQKTRGAAVGLEMAQGLGRIFADAEGADSVTPVIRRQDEEAPAHSAARRILDLDHGVAGRRTEGPAPASRRPQGPAFGLGRERRGAAQRLELDGGSGQLEVGKQLELRDAGAHPQAQWGDGRGAGERSLGGRIGRRSGGDAGGQGHGRGQEEGRKPGERNLAHGLHGKPAGRPRDSRRFFGTIAAVLFASAAAAGGQVPDPRLAPEPPALTAATPPGPPAVSPLAAGTAALLAARARLAAEVEAGGWPPVPEGKALEPGSTGHRVAALRRRLAASGDFEPEAAATAFAFAETFDPALEAAVRRFQTRHGLEVDGKVGRATAAALAVPAARRLEQVDATLARRRALAEFPGQRFVLVNLPAFELEGYEGGQRVLTMKVVVGRPDLPSPELASQATRIQLNPYWNVPSSITRRELAPREAKEPGYLAGLAIRIFAGPAGAGELAAAEIDWMAVARGDRPVFLRQEPGPKNSLGRLRLEVPNDEGICLHDTPEKRAFERPERALSHGCVRLEDAVGLAAFLLRDDPSWSGPALEAAIATGRQREIALPRPVPVYLVYWTAWVGDDGRLQLRDDIYGRDAPGVRLPPPD